MRRFAERALLALLFLFLLATAAPEKTKGFFLVTGIYDCCKGEKPNAWCEHNGCWLPPSNCDSDDDCNLN